MESKSVTIFVFGASGAYGAWDEEGSGWVARLRKYLDREVSNAEREFYIFNLGVSGNTTEELLDRLEFETYQRVREGGEFIFLFEIGLNDSSFIKTRNENRVLPDDFKENLQYLITLAKKYSENIIFMGLTPINEKEFKPWIEDLYYENKYVEQYDEIIKSVCSANNLLFVDILNEFKKSGKEVLLYEDGLHPNSAGHQKIFEIAKSYLMQNNLI